MKFMHQASAEQFTAVHTQIEDVLLDGQPVLMYRAFTSAKAHCDKWHDYEMSVAPYENGKPIYYEFTACPVAEFAI